MEKTTNSHLLPAGTSRDGQFQKRVKGRCPPGKNPPRQAIGPTWKSRNVRSAAASWLVTSCRFFVRPMLVRSVAKWASCCAEKGSTHRT